MYVVSVLSNLSNFKPLFSGVNLRPELNIYILQVEKLTRVMIQAH